VHRLVCIALALAACKGKEPAREPARPSEPAGGGSAASPAPVLTGWSRIEALAAQVASPGPTVELERALAFASTNRAAWSALRYERPSPPLDRYPQGADAIAALQAWANAGGGLPPLESIAELGEVGRAMHDVGSLAVETATDARSLAAAGYLATQLVHQGRNLLEIQMGTALIRSARYRLRALELPVDGIEVSAVDVVRMLAAEALSSRRSLEHAASPEGRKELNDRLQAMEPEARETVKAMTGKELKALIATDEQSAALMQFWLAALDGAQRGEAANTTIERARRAAEASPAVMKDTTAQIVSILERLRREIDQLGEPQP
jgi:hypothetical protein